MTTEQRTYTRSGLAAMPQRELAAIADDLKAAAREGRIVSEPLAAPSGNGPVFTRSQLAAMSHAEINRRRAEIVKAVQGNRFRHDQ